MLKIGLALLLLLHFRFGVSVESIAKKWNEVLLEAIRNDFARPTVHARNLFHVSAAMYDAWAVFDDSSKTYLLGNQLNGFTNSFRGIKMKDTINSDQEKAISYAAYRLLNHRFKSSPNADFIENKFDSLMINLNYDINNASIDYSSGNAAALGNYIAQVYIDYGLQDGSNESNEYENTSYETVNPYLLPTESGNSTIQYPNKWQPLAFDEFIDQSGNAIVGEVPDFLSPEWGSVLPFALDDSVKVTYSRNGSEYHVYHDPGLPSYIYPDSTTEQSEAYQWGFSLVSKWSSHLDTVDAVVWDISPASIGNLTSYPATFEEYQSFYDEKNGGDNSSGHSLNPHTGLSYVPQYVKRGDYGRVLAEFWADGPDSETPPGHWFTILNYVSDHELLNKKMEGKGDTISDLEWDIKSYFILGGAMHDAAISVWSVKGWYDYIRPISAIRYLCDQGQCSDSTLPNYSTAGIPLDTGFIELVDSNDALVGNGYEHYGKIKLKAWTGPDSISDASTDMAGVNWILAENWWPYQRPTFVTPPFAGYVSGHSTFSRAAAVVLSKLTGDEFFPGGIAEFVAKKNEFLVFEEGPSQDIKLQWATYKDAADQCSLSRIWGGIHPPIDDIPGRKIGEKVGEQSFNYSKEYFSGGKKYESFTNKMSEVYPSIIEQGQAIKIYFQDSEEIHKVCLHDLSGNVIDEVSSQGSLSVQLPSGNLSAGIYIVKVESSDQTVSQKIIIN